MIPLPPPSRGALEATIHPHEAATRLTTAAREIAASGARERLLLVVGGPRTGKTTALRSAAASLDWPLVNLNLALAERLLSVPVKQRDVRVSDVARAVADERPGAGLVVDNIEMLFQVDLKADAGALLRSLARQRPVIAAWPGQYDGAAVTYATPLHPEYTSWAQPDAYILQLSSFAA